jgi:UDP-N-acetylmuramoyl-L-alanyl-D-glutamate--2,6-diaminopimelate ligase
MKLLKDILYKTGAIEIVGSTQLAIFSITADSRAVQKNGLFVAVRGTRSDGHKFISEVCESGAIAIVCEQLPERLQDKVCYVVVKDSAPALSVLAANFYDNPSEKLHLIGVTGTNGKTTTATLLHTLFTRLGYACGLISTVVNRIADEEVPSTHTTPDPLQLQQLLSRMVDAGCSYVFMEVSSHAVVQHRVSALRFKGGIFTNITHDHLDYHGTFENYLSAKHGFFKLLPSDAFALINIDDEHFSEMSELLKAPVKTYGFSQAADFKVRILEKQFGGMLLKINERELWTNLIGAFNAYNLLAVYGAAILLGQNEDEVLQAMSLLHSVEGRFQYVKSASGITAIVDYAHTPDALRNVLLTIADLRTGNEQLITLIGCGGDRDRAKRPEMAEIASLMSDKFILTSDNPRSEDPQAIIAEMKEGVNPAESRKMLCIVDRREAIRTAVHLAKAGDIILIAGKGHEKYQEIQGVKLPFDDMAEAKEQFNQMAR